MVDKNLVTALAADQSVVRDYSEDNVNYDYVDNNEQDAEFTEVSHKDKAEKAMEATVEKIAEKSKGNE